jgi:hypothetical protein
VRVAATFLMSCLDPVDVLEAHALRRLVEQHQLRVHRQRRRDLEGALPAVAELDRGHLGVGGEVDRAEQVERLGVEHLSDFSGFQKWNEVPSFRCSATRTFSSTERWANTAEIWNERTTPIRAIATGVSAVMSRPS